MPTGGWASRESGFTQRCTPKWTAPCTCGERSGARRLTSPFPCRRWCSGWRCRTASERSLVPALAQGAHRVVAVVRAGAGPMRPHAESNVNSVAQEQYENGGLGAQVGGGLELSLWRGLGAVGEYKFTWASPEIEVAGGQAKVPARSHHVTFGVRYGF